MSKAIFASLAVAVVVTSSAGAALAQEGPAHDLHRKGHFILSADRLVPLFGYTSVKQTNPANGDSNSTATTDFSFMTAGSQQDLGTFYTIPRVSFDGTIIDGLTLGGSFIAYFTLGKTEETVRHLGNGVVTTTDTQGTKTTAWGIAPRVGYILALGANFAFWPRGGFSYTSASFSTPNDNGVIVTGSLNQFSLNAEAMFVWTPVHHFGITFGPVIDIPVSGSGTGDVAVGSLGFNNNRDTTQFHTGVTAGILGWL